MTTERIRTLVVDDEPLAREGLLALLAGDPEIEVVGACAEGREAFDAMRRLHPALVFLDVQMPEMDGFEVLEALEADEEAVPVVVFVTAYDQYALRAFEMHALDYLLKPFEEQRFAVTLDRVRRELATARTREAHDRLLAFVRENGDDVALCVNNLSRFPQPIELNLQHWNGYTPVELTGHVNFPRVGQLPYLLTLPGHGFYWFQLCRSEETQ